MTLSLAVVCEAPAEQRTGCDLADRVFQAGLDLFVEMGVYNQSTERRVIFSRQEVVDAVAAAPHAVTLGTGRDAVVMKHLAVAGNERAIVHCGPTGTPSSERCHPLILQSGAQEPLVDWSSARSARSEGGQRASLSLSMKAQQHGAIASAGQSISSVHWAGRAGRAIASTTNTARASRPLAPWMVRSCTAPSPSPSSCPGSGSRTARFLSARTRP